MGYGLPASIGAQIARPDKLVFDIAGDGSIQMNIQELTPALVHKLPIKIAIMNNRFLGRSDSGRSCSGTEGTLASILPLSLTS